MAPLEGIAAASCLVPRSGSWRLGTLADVGTALQATRFSLKPGERDTVRELAVAQGDGGSVGVDFRRVVPDSPCNERGHTPNLEPRKARNNAKRRGKRLT